jgi:Holliday junction resolvasome RuvABC endonuclease subunit
VAGDGGGSDYSACLVGIDAWLTDILAVIKPARCAFEAPIIIPKRSAQTMRLLMYIAGVAELCCAKAKVPVYEISVSTARKGFCGSGRADKPMVQQRCRQLGWQFRNDDEADALAVWHALAVLDPKWRMPDFRLFQQEGARK